MRVLSISALPPLRDGIAAYTAALTRGYQSEGHQVAAIATAAGAEAENLVEVLPRTPIGAVRVARRAAAWQPELVHLQHAIATYGAQLPSLLAVVALLRWRHGLRVVITHHEVTRDTDRLRIVGRLYYRMVSAMASDLHVHTPGAAARLRGCGVRGAIEVVPHPIFSAAELGVTPVQPTAIAELRRRLGQGRVLVMMIGYLQNQKGHDRAVAALADLLRRRPDLRDRIRLVIAGEVRSRPPGLGGFERADHDYQRRVRDLVEREGLRDQVRWQGHVPEQELSTWFAAADAVLLPYLVAEDSAIAARAVAAGTPVLAAPVGGLADLFGCTELALASTEPADFSAALERLVEQPAGLRAAAGRIYHDLLQRRSASTLVRTCTQAPALWAASGRSSLGGTL